ncbi:hypothetical protein RND81_09G033400 [Saponaria officinalis]|uniref:Reverse transcriptase zinc-binding domain-containing protein n=1 Tax=Saponaria officinalis TaxID=3572 RepID=A0AAW1IHG4_SAPOF
MCNDALATKHNIAIRLHNNGDTFCPLCSNDSETSLHLFRGCRVGGGIWGRLGLEVLKSTGFERGMEWVEAVWRDMGERERVEFMTGCWAVWEWRNKAVFEGSKMGVEDVVRRARDIMSEIEGMRKGAEAREGA